MNNKVNNKHNDLLNEILKEEEEIFYKIEKLYYEDKEHCNAKLC